MIKVVGIRFQRAGKIYYFDPLDYDLETAMHVIVETARGVEMGTVLIPPKGNRLHGASETFFPLYH